MSDLGGVTWMESYAALRAERDELRAALVTLCEEIDEAVESCDINRAAEARNDARALMASASGTEER